MYLVMSRHRFKCELLAQELQEPLEASRLASPRRYLVMAAEARREGLASILLDERTMTRLIALIDNGSTFIDMLSSLFSLSSQ